MVHISVLLCTNEVNSRLYEAMDSILNQDFQEIELILVFNNLTEDLILEVKNHYQYYSQIVYLENNINYVNFSINQGLSVAKGEFIARMDADDISYRNRLLVQYNFLKKNSNILMCGSWINIINDQGQTVDVIRYPTSNKSIRRQLIYRNPICHPSTMYRKKIVLDSGGYINSIFAEDYDLWVRLATKKDHHFANIPEPLLGYRQISSGKARFSPIAYKSVATTQFSQFLSTGNVLWLIGSFLSIIKMLIKQK